MCREIVTRDPKKFYLIPSFSCLSLSSLSLSLHHTSPSLFLVCLFLLQIRSRVMFSSAAAAAAARHVRLASATASVRVALWAREPSHARGNQQQKNCRTTHSLVSHRILTLTLMNMCAQPCQPPWVFGSALTVSLYLSRVRVLAHFPHFLAFPSPLRPFPCSAELRHCHRRRSAFQVSRRLCLSLARHRLSRQVHKPLLGTCWRTQPPCLVVFSLSLSVSIPLAFFLSFFLPWHLFLLLYIYISLSYLSCLSFL